MIYATRVYIQADQGFLSAGCKEVGQDILCAWSSGTEVQHRNPFASRIKSIFQGGKMAYRRFYLVACC